MKLLEHDHPAKQEECTAEIKIFGLKRIAEKHPDQAPSQILYTELAGVSAEVLGQLPEWESFITLTRRAQHHLLPNPKILSELTDLPEKYKKTFSEDNLLVYNSRNDDDE